MAKRQQNFRLDDDLIGRLRAVADGRPLIEVIRRALTEYVERAEATSVSNPVPPRGRG